MNAGPEHFFARRNINFWCTRGWRGMKDNNVIAFSSRFRRAEFHGVKNAVRGGSFGAERARGHGTLTAAGMRIDDAVTVNSGPNRPRTLIGRVV